MRQPATVALHRRLLHWGPIVALSIVGLISMPTVFCHRLVVDGDRIVDYRLRQHDQKRHAVEALHGLNFRVIAAGDSYNDTSMLSAADCGFLFKAPQNVRGEFPQFTAVDEFEDLLPLILDGLG